MTVASATWSSEQTTTESGHKSLLSIAADVSRFAAHSTYKLTGAVIMRAGGRDVADKTEIATNTYELRCVVDVAADGSLSLLSTVCLHEASSGPEELHDLAEPYAEIVSGAFVVYGWHPIELNGITVKWGVVLRAESLTAEVAEGTAP